MGFWEAASAGTAVGLCGTDAEGGPSVLDVVAGDCSWCRRTSLSELARLQLRVRAGIPINHAKESRKKEWEGRGGKGVGWVLW